MKRDLKVGTGVLFSDGGLAKHVQAQVLFKKPHSLRNIRRAKQGSKMESASKVRRSGWSDWESRQVEVQSVVRLSYLREGQRSVWIPY